MNTKLLIPLFAAMFFSVAAHAHDCSGGVNGGMDATGNQCNDTADVATVATLDRTMSSTAQAPKNETNKATTCSNCVNKTTVQPRHVTAHQRIKHS